MCKSSRLLRTLRGGAVFPWRYDTRSHDRFAPSIAQSKFTNSAKMTTRARHLIYQLRIVRLAMMMGLIPCSASLLYAADPSSPPAGTIAIPAPAKQEIKLFMTAANAERAITELKLDKHRAVHQIACFFDTADGTLQANHLILRARQKADAPGESTVKIRVTDVAAELTAAERAMELELDWTSENKVAFSRSISHSALPVGMVAQAAAGKIPTRLLFNESQRDLVSARIKDFDWDRLRCFGPVKVKVWRKHCKIDGFTEKVTVELWHLQRDGKKKDILEVSVKTTAESDAHARALANQFYAAAKAAGMGEPAALTKTQVVMDFLNPAAIESQPADKKEAKPSILYEKQ